MKAALLALLVGVLQPAPIRILFIGNSLTYTNDVPGMVATLAKAAGRRVEVQVIAYPDFSLEDHWKKGEARRAIERGGWTTVVLQQGPSALPESRALLIDYTKRFDGAIRKAGAKTALYMVWPSRARRRDFDGVERSYAEAARAVDGGLAPVGRAWRAAWRLHGEDLPLYGPDGLHPSPTGSYLAALVIYRHVIGEPAPALPVAGGDPKYAPVLQQAAESVAPRAPQ